MVELPELNGQVPQSANSENDYSRGPHFYRTGCCSRANTFPPRCLITTAMGLAMMATAQRHCEFIADLAAERAGDRRRCDAGLVFQLPFGVEGRALRAAAESDNRQLRKSIKLNPNLLVVRETNPIAVGFSPRAETHTLRPAADSGRPWPHVSRDRFSTLHSSFCELVHSL